MSCAKKEDGSWPELMRDISCPGVSAVCPTTIFAENTAPFTAANTIPEAPMVVGAKELPVTETASDT
jgi:hypothetical protein